MLNEPRSAFQPPKFNHNNPIVLFRVPLVCAAQQRRYFYGTKSRLDRTALHPYLARTCTRRRLQWGRELMPAETTVWPSV